MEDDEDDGPYEVGRLYDSWGTPCMLCDDERTVMIVIWAGDETVPPEEGEERWLVFCEQHFVKFVSEGIFGRKFVIRD